MNLIHNIMRVERMRIQGAQVLLPGIIFCLVVWGIITITSKDPDNKSSDDTDDSRED